jgi:hypothetical protein
MRTPVVVSTARLVSMAAASTAQVDSTVVVDTVADAGN